MEKKFQVRAYGIQELGLQYFPHSTPASASTQLKKWINRNKKLTEELHNAGYYVGQKLLTPRQVAIIVYYIGEP